MVSFKCKVCNKNTEGVGPENKWRCPKCNNKALIKELLACHSRGLDEEIDFRSQNQNLLKIVKKFQGIESGSDNDISEEEDNASSEGSDEEWVPDSQEKNKAKSRIKWKLFEVRDNLPAKKAKSDKVSTKTNEPVPAAKNNNRNPTSDYSIILSQLYKGDSHFYPSMPFDNGADKFTGSEHEKEMLISAIKKQKQRIIFKLQDIFVDVNNVKMRLTNKGQQISHLCFQ